MGYLHKITAVLLLAAGPASAGSQIEPRIEELLPAQTELVLLVENMPRLLDQWSENPLARLWNDERMRSALQLFFRGQCHNSCVLVHEGSAEISILDLDGYKGQELLEEHRTRYPERPLIALSLKQVQLDGVLCLEKPLNPQKLLAALHQVKAQLAVAEESVTASAGAGAIQGKSLEEVAEMHLRDSFWNS